MTPRPDPQAAVTATAGRETRDRLINLREVMRQTGLGKTRVYMLERARDFPRHIKEGASSLWLESEVQAWIRTRVERARAA